MPRTSSRARQLNAKPNTAADGDLAALIEQCSRDVRYGLNTAFFLCSWVQNDLSVLEQIEPAQADRLMSSVKHIVAYYRAADASFRRVKELVQAVASATCAHSESLGFTHSVQSAFDASYGFSEIPEIEDNIVSRWGVIRDWLIKVKLPDLSDLIERIKVESAKAIVGQRCRTDRDSVDRKFTDGVQVGDPPSSKNLKSKTKLAGRFENAYRSYMLAERELLIQGAKTVTDRQAWEHLNEHGCDVYENDGFKPPPFETSWKWYLTHGRKHYGTPKNTRRSGRKGGSIVDADEI